MIAAIDQKISNWDWTMEVGYRAHSRVRTLLAIERVMQVDLFIPGFRICLSETEALVKGEVRIYFRVVMCQEYINIRIGYEVAEYCPAS